MSDVILRGPRAHSLRLTMRDGVVSPQWTCHASEGADCRLTCPDGCEEWDLIEHDHTLVDAGYCLVVEGLDAVDIEESHLGEAVIYDGPFDYEWDSGFTFTLPAAEDGS